MTEAMFCRTGGECDKMADVIWSHMVRTAPIGRALGRLFGMNQDEAFLIAMMHDIGKLVVFDRIGVLRTARREPKFPEHFVTDVLRLVHESLGGLSALEWGLGDVAAGAIGSRHRDELFDFSDLASQMVYAAERADLARTDGTKTLAEAWVADGRLSVDATAIEAQLPRCRAT